MTTKLSLRFHQELIVKKTQTLLQKGTEHILWACKPRSGKTYMAAGLILLLNQNAENCNILITTSHPTEVRSQFTDDLFNQYDDFKEFTINDIKNGSELNNLRFTNSEKNIVFISKQLLQRVMEIKENVLKLKNKFCCVFFDENHEGGTTKKTQEILEQLEIKTKIYMTGTPNKTIKKWNVSEESQLFWMLEDERMCCDILENIFEKDRFVEKHGKIANQLFNKFIKNGTLEQCLEYYTKLPKLTYITTLFQKNKLQEMFVEDGGFCFSTLFKMDASGEKFMFQKEIDVFLQYISKDIMTRVIKNIEREETRNCKTQLWFLPPNGVDKISRCLSKLIKEVECFKDCKILIINSKQGLLGDQIKKKIEKAEESGNVIILAGSMLQLGVSLKKCDLVMLFNDTSSSDKIIQETFRSMTEDDGKKVGFVVDLYPGRIMEVIQQNDLRKGVGVKDALENVLQHKLINLDVDNFYEEELDISTLMDKMMEEWIKMPIHTYSSILNRLDEELGEFDDYTQSLISNCISKVCPTTELKVTIYEREKIPKGKDSSETHSSSNDELKLIDDNEINKRAIFFRKEVLPYVIQLVSVLTVKENMVDFIQLLQMIKKDETLIECFNEQTNSLWKEDDMIDSIIQIASGLNNSPINDICLSIKMKIKNLINYPNELLQLITDCLKPRDIEKRKYGEVFTPMSFINDKMLLDLDQYWIQHKGNSIWEEKNFKWLDPSAGMGNYPVAIFYKLMEGLKYDILDEEERRRWILEKMIYMGELNKKNCYIINQLFNMNGEYKINLYRGDTLNVRNVFEEVETFNVVIGNPPYNEEFKGKTSSPLYHKFIKGYVNRTDMLSYIIPSRWFGGGKGLGKFREEMLEREDIVYINHIDDASDIFGNSVDIKGGVNYFLIHNKWKGLCKFNGSMMKLNKFDILVDQKYYGLIDKLERFPRLNMYYRPSNYFDIDTNDKRLGEYKEKKELIKCYVSKMKGFEKWIDKKCVTKPIDKWKVITPRAAYQHGSGFGNIFIGRPGEVCSHTYIFFELESEEEAIMLKEYLSTHFANVMLSLRKVSQDISESTCKWIPIPPLNQVWTNDMLFQYFGIWDEKEIVMNTKV